MFIKDTDILKNIEDSQVGKKVVSINIANEIKNKLDLFLVENSKLIEKIDGYSVPYIQEKLGVLSGFPITNPIRNGKYVYNSKVYKLIGNTHIVKMVVNVRNCYLLFDNGDVYCCGSNTYGEGGFDETGVKNVHTKVTFNENVLDVGDKIVDIISSGYSTHFLTEKGKLIVCGHNARGSLGIGNTTNQTKKVKMEFSFPSMIKKVISGGTMEYESTFYLLEDGKIYACGSNENGQLCCGDNAVKNAPTDITSKFPTKIIYVSTGGYTTNGGTTMFLTDDNRIFVSGYNNSGQLGNGTTTNSNMPIMIEGIPKDKKITHIASGGGITSFVLNNRELYSAGYGGTGALGTGATANLNKHTLIKTFDCDIKQVKHYASVASEAFSAVLLTDGTVYTCGYNANGQLGKNHTANSAWYGRICCEEKIKEIGLSYRGLHMLNYDGEIIVYGNNDKHQLGTSVTNTVTYNYQYAVFFAERVLKSSYQKPDEDFIQIL